VSEPTPIVVITGPTASGKEAVGLLCAQRRGTEIVTVDSIKVYRGMDIGTAKATADQQALVAHHCLDLAEPAERFSTGRWLTAAEAAIAAVAARGKVPLLVGGTALYLKALGEGLIDGPGADPTIRDRLLAEAETLGDAVLHARMAQADPAAGARIHPNDRKRIVRALEVFELTGVPLSHQQHQWKNENPKYRITWVGIRRSREDQRDRIGRRVLRMFERGLVDEVRGLAEGMGPTARQALAYAEVLEHIEGRLSLDDAVRQTIDHTRQFARRQQTWFRKFTTMRWVDAGADEPTEAIAERALAAME